MAILMNGWRGQSRKKIGNDVTYVLKGQQIARSKAANIANPRTASQMTQRIKMSNVVAMYRANKSWMDRYAFENKKQKWSVFNAFVSANLSGSLVALTKQEAASGAAVIAPYRMTDGTLSEIHVNENIVTNLFETDLFVGALELGANTTIGELSAALIANNNGIVNGMQLSLVENFQDVQNNIPRVTTRAYELIIDSTSTALVSSRISSASFVTGGTAGAHVLAYDGQTGSSAQGILFVLSHTIAGKTYVSPSTMTMTDPAVYDSYTSSTAVDLAIQSYGSTNETPFLDSSEVAASTEGSVALTPTITGARLGSGNFVSPGGVLGKTPSDTSVRLEVKLSNDGWGEPSAITIQTTDSGSDAVEQGSFSVDGNNVFSVLLVDAPGRDEYITKVVVAWSNGQTTNASFAVGDDSGVTE